MEESASLTAGLPQDSESKDLLESVFAGLTTLVGADLSGLDLSERDLRGADLSRANLTGARLFGCRLDGATLFEVQAKGAEFACTNFSGATLTRGDFSAAGFGRAGLRAADARGAKFDGALMTDTDLHDAELDGSSLKSARLVGARLEPASLVAADLTDVDASGAHMGGARFRGVRFGRATLAAIEWDPTLTVKLLGTVNSAAYAPKKPIGDVRHAVTYLGRGQLESLVLAVAAQRALAGVGARAFDAGAFWAVAARRAALARIVCDYASPAHSSETFTAALLLNCAVPVLAGAFGDQYRAVIEFYFGNASPDGATITRLESEGVGADHAQAGALLAASWGLPDGLVRAIRMQHVPDASPADLRAARKLVVDQGVGGDSEDRARFAREATSLVGLPAARAEEAFERSLIDSVELAKTLAA